MKNIVNHRGRIAVFLVGFVAATLTACSGAESPQQADSPSRGSSSQAGSNSGPSSSYLNSPCPKPYRANDDLPLMKCDKGESVQYAQSMLGVEADGYFGDGTLAALLEFQAQCGIPRTGTIDQRTWDALTTNYYCRGDGNQGSDGGEPTGNSPPPTEAPVQRSVVNVICTTMSYQQGFPDNVAFTLRITTYWSDGTTTTRTQAAGAPC